MSKISVRVAAALVIGLAVWIVLDRVMLERHTANPFVMVSAADVKRSSPEGADPTPAEGTRIVRPLPLGRMRKVVGEEVGKVGQTPLVMTVGSVGRGDEGAGLHLVLENRGRCKITEFEGVAYAYDAWGKPAKANKGGEHYVAFRATKQAIAPGESALFEQLLKYPDTASLAVAMVDKVACDDGTSWKRQ